MESQSALLYKGMLRGFWRCKTAKNKNGHPWIDAELKKQIRRQQRLYKKMKKTGDPDIKKAYRIPAYGRSRSSGVMIPSMYRQYACLVSLCR
jgi:hypothetical protein